VLCVLDFSFWIRRILKPEIDWTHQHDPHHSWCWCYSSSQNCELLNMGSCWNLFQFLHLQQVQVMVGSPHLHSLSYIRCETCFHECGSLLCPPKWWHFRSNLVGCRCWPLPFGQMPYSARRNCSWMSYSITPMIIFKSFLLYLHKFVDIVFYFFLVFYLLPLYKPNRIPCWTSCTDWLCLLHNKICICRDYSAWIRSTFIYAIKLVQITLLWVQLSSSLIVIDM